MNKRIHSSLGYLTPVEVEYNWNRQNMIVEVKRPVCVSSFLGSVQWFYEIEEET